MSNFCDDYDYSEYLSNVHIVHSTKDAILVKHKLRQAWFPKSIINSIEDGDIEYCANFEPNWQAISIKKSIEGDFI